MKTTQKQMILGYLQGGGTITQGQALRWYSVGRLASRINDLRNDGYNISAKMVTEKNQFGQPVKVASYKLQEGEPKPKSERLYCVVYDETNNLIIGITDSRSGVGKLIKEYLPAEHKLFSEEKSRDTETLVFMSKDKWVWTLRRGATTIIITHCKLNSLRW